MKRQLAMAALASGWPELSVECRDEAEMLEVRGRIEELLGPLPGLVELEGDHQLPWAIRVVLPGLDTADGLLLLASLEAFDAVLRPANTPGLQEALDRGLAEIDVISEETGESECLVDLVEGGLPTPQLILVETEDPAFLALAAELEDATRPYQVRVNPVRHLMTGRAGVRLEVLGGDDDLARRATGLAALRGREQLEPVARWWERLDRLTAVSWWLSPPGIGVEPSGRTDWGGLAALDEAHGLCEEAELSLVVEGRDHDDAVASVLALASDSWRGGPGRWVGRNFCPTWCVPLGEVADAARKLSSFGEVAARPGCPLGLEADWAVSDARSWWGRARVALQVRDGIWDRDRSPMVVDRTPGELEVRVLPLCAGLPILEAPRPVVDTVGREGVVLSLSPGIRPSKALRALLDTPVPGVAPWLDLSFSPTRARVMVWGAEGDVGRSWTTPRGSGLDSEGDASGGMPAGAVG